MKKKGVIIAFMIVIAVILSGYLVYNDMFPIAKPIQYPSIEAITSISISTDNNNEMRFVKGIFTIENSFYQGP